MTENHDHGTRHHDHRSIGDDDSIEEAARTMAEHQVRRLPVVDGTKLVGMLVQADLARSGNDAATGNTFQAGSE